MYTNEYTGNLILDLKNTTMDFYRLEEIYNLI